MCGGRDGHSIKPPLGLKFYEKNLYRKVLKKSVTTSTHSVFFYEGKKNMRKGTVKNLRLQLWNQSRQQTKREPASCGREQ